MKKSDHSCLYWTIGIDAAENFLGDRLHQGEQQGLSEGAVTNLAYENR